MSRQLRMPSRRCSSEVTGRPGDFLLQHERGGGGERYGGAHGDGVARHDLMRAFVKGDSIAIYFRQGADVRADGFQQVAIGNDADERAVLDDQQVMEAVFLEELLDGGQGAVHCDSHEAPGYDRAGGRMGREGLYVQFHRLSCLVVSGAVACAVFAPLSVERAGF